MDAHFEAKRFKRDMPEPERHARLFAHGLTKHSYETVVAALTDLADAHDEYLEAYAALWDYVYSRTDEQDRRYPAWERFAPDDVKEVMNVHLDVFNDTPSLGMSAAGFRGNQRESFPVTRWAKDAARYRRGAKAMRQAVAKAKGAIAA